MRRRAPAAAPGRATFHPLVAASVVVLATAVVLAAAGVVSLPAAPGADDRASAAAPAPTRPAPVTPAMAPVRLAERAPGPDDAEGGSPTALTTPCRATARACAQLSTQHVWLLAGGRVVRDGFISSGTTDMRTPTGVFQVRYKSVSHYSRKYDTPMPYAVFFDDDGDALHEGSLARQSRGCVHLEHDDAVAFFDALRPGDEVQVLP